MKIVVIDVKGVKVVSCRPKENQVELEVQFHAEKDKQFRKAVRLDDPGKSADLILFEIKNIERSVATQTKTDKYSDGFFRILMNNEQDAKQRLALFLSELATKLDYARGIKSADSLVDALTRIKIMRLDF